MSGWKTSLVLAGACLVAGCATALSDRNIRMYSVAAESWVGRTGSEMREAWGTPSETVGVRDTEGLPGESVELMVWDYGDHGAAEPEGISAAMLSQSSMGGDCSRPGSQWEGVPSTCRQDPLRTYYNQGYRGQRPHCKVIATVIDGVIASVQVENQRCHLTDAEFAQFARPGTPLPE